MKHHKFAKLIDEIVHLISYCKLDSGASKETINSLNEVENKVLKLESNRYQEVVNLFVYKKRSTIEAAWDDDLGFKAKNYIGTFQVVIMYDRYTKLYTGFTANKGGPIICSKNYENLRQKMKDAIITAFLLEKIKKARR